MGFRKILAAFLLMSVMGTGNGEAAYAVFDSKNYSANLETNAKMVEQVINSARQLEYQLRDIQSLDGAEFYMSMDNAYNVFKGIEDIRRQSDAIGEDWLTTLAQWKEMNPDYSAWDMATLERYAAQVDKHRNRWDKTLEQALLMAGLASVRENQRTSDEVLNSIRLSSKANGSVQALQAAAQLSAIQIGELERLKAMYSEMMKIQVMAQQREMDEARRAARQTKDFFKGNSEAMDKNVAIRNKGQGIHELRLK